VGEDPLSFNTKIIINAANPSRTVISGSSVRGAESVNTFASFQSTFRTLKFIAVLSSPNFAIT
jgi:hypothetical protein